MLVMAKRRIKIPTPDELREIRARLKLTQAQAADRVAVTRETWATWECAMRKPSRPASLLIWQLSKENL